MKILIPWLAVPNLLPSPHLPQVLLPYKQASGHMGFKVTHLTLQAHLDSHSTIWLLLGQAATQFICNLFQGLFLMLNVELTAPGIHLTHMMIHTLLHLLDHEELPPKLNLSGTYLHQFQQQVFQTIEDLQETEQFTPKMLSELFHPMLPFSTSLHIIRWAKEGFQCT